MHLHAKSGSLSPLKHFAYDVREIVRRQTLPGYRLVHHARPKWHRASELRAYPGRSIRRAASQARARSQVGGWPVNQLVLSGTTTLVPSGTRSSCYRGPKSGLRHCCATLFSARNFPNLEILRISSNGPAIAAAGDNQQGSREHSSPLPLPMQSQRIGKTWLRQQDVAHGRIAMALLSVKHSHRLPGFTTRSMSRSRSMAKAHCRRRLQRSSSSMEEVHERSHPSRAPVA